MNAAALLALFRARVKAEGPSAPFFVEQRDAYSNEPVPFEPAAIDPNADPVETGYTSQTLNPVYKKLPALTFLATEEGIVGGFFTARQEGEKQEDVQLKSLRRLYSNRKRIIAETGTYPGASTELLKNNPNDSIDTPIDNQDLDNDR